MNKKENKFITVATDGSGNVANGTAGYGFFIPYLKKGVGEKVPRHEMYVDKKNVRVGIDKNTSKNGTNNRGEYLAFIEAVFYLYHEGYKKIHVQTDSMLLINTYTKWMENWNKAGVWNKDKLNIDLVKIFYFIKHELDVTITFQHVKSHQKIVTEAQKNNDTADQLAKLGMAKNV